MIEVKLNDFLAAGFWPGWKESDHGEAPVMVHQDQDGQDITLIGINPTFRGHPKNTFRLIGNAIYNGVEK